ncbi:hypothetical protein GCM10010932_30830 [Agromyces flavus]|nr:hypothetical protein GCM10010932_30830 [Agromyces flavus]
MPPGGGGGVVPPGGGVGGVGGGASDMMLAPWKVAPGSRVVVIMLAQRDAPVEACPTGASRAAKRRIT